MPCSFLFLFSIKLIYLVLFLAGSFWGEERSFWLPGSVDPSQSHPEALAGKVPASGQRWWLWLRHQLIRHRSGQSGQLTALDCPLWGCKVRPFPFTCSSGLLSSEHRCKECWKSWRFSWQRFCLIRLVHIVLLLLVCWPMTAFCLFVFFPLMEKRLSPEGGEVYRCMCTFVSDTCIRRLLGRSSQPQRLWVHVSLSLPASSVELTENKSY